MSVSEAQLNANRENALHSTGPRTPDGKAKAALNAGKHFLSGQTIVMPGDNLELYFASAKQFREECANARKRGSPWGTPNRTWSRLCVIPSGAFIGLSPMKRPSTRMDTTSS